MYGNLRHLVQVLDLSLLLVAPSNLKQAVVIEERGLFGHMLVRGQRATADWSRNPPLLSRLLFDQLIRDMPGLPVQGQYVSAHLLIPHPPANLSAECRYEANRPRNKAILVDQAICATKMMAAFTDLLRQNGRLRNALIIIHSDHGVYERHRPLLLVKYPGHDAEPMRRADHDVQLIDIAPTIVDAAKLPYPPAAVADFDGISLRKDEPGIRNLRVWTSDDEKRK